MSAPRRGATASFTPSPALLQPAPPGSRLRVPRDDDNSELRPRTCPILTSQFHWNLNAHAIKSLSEEELLQVYRLFRFYDSSTVGDSLPSINCRRFLQLLGDGGLLTSNPRASPVYQSSDSLAEESGDVRLEVAAVEKIFAEAVMGKLRTYFDADGLPVLTFHLFCGALMNCAMAIFPKHNLQHEVAMMKLLEKLLTSVEHYADERQREPRRHKSLLQHFPKEGQSALWLPDEAHGAVAFLPLSSKDGSTEVKKHDPDFRTMKPFQQVLASFAVDVVIDSRARERAVQQYTIPADLTARFTPDNLALVVERFKLFDVFDRGTLPRQEILPLLTGLVKKLEITDMYEVLTLLLTGDHVPRYGKFSSIPQEPSHSSPTGEISLTEVLRAIYTCRRSRTASIYGSSHTAASRKRVGNHAHKTALSDELGGESDARIAAAASKCGENEDDDVGNLEGGAGMGGKRANKKSLRKSKASGSFAQSLASSKQINASKNTSDKKSSSGAKKLSIESRQKQSTLLNKDQDLDGGARVSTITQRVSRRKSKMALLPDGASANTDAESTDSGEYNLGETEVSSHDTEGLRNQRVSPIDQRETSKNQVSTASASHSTAFSEKPMIMVTPPSLFEPIAVSPATGTNVKSNSKAQAHTQVIRVFMLLGGDHDGAICSSVKLTLPQRHIEEMKGIFNRNGPHEVIEQSSVLPVQPNSESALLMLKKRVQQRLSEGFVLHPHDQLARVDSMLNQIRQSNPHYQSPLSVHYHHSTGNLDALPSPSAFDATLDRKALGTSGWGSLDRAATCVRQTSSSDLLVELSDSLTHQILRSKKRVVLSRGESTRSQNDSSRTSQNGGRPVSTEASSDDMGWIRSVNDANRSRERLLQSSASTPLLSGGLSKHQVHQQRPSQQQKPHHRGQLQPIF